MDVIETPRELQRRADRARAAGRRIALVPTMGALHKGHLALVTAARQQAEETWVSIFVNPTQFGAGEDLERYPRPRERDLALCRERGVSVVFAPTPDAMYADGAQTWVEVSELTKPLCGRARPEHFRGVTTVVTKLLLAAKPHVAVFGEKDFQQLAVIRRMVRDLGIDVEIVGVPTVREADGVALSSRNALLDAENRRQAVVLVRALAAAEHAVAAGLREADAVLDLVRVELRKAAGAAVDYAELRDPESLAPAPARLAGPTLLALAVRFTNGPDAQGSVVRLIDNRILQPQRADREDVS